MSETIEKIKGIGFTALGQNVWITCECGSAGWANFSKYIRDSFKWAEVEGKNGLMRKVRDKSVHVRCNMCGGTISMEEFKAKQDKWKEDHPLT
jgi:hypothetical protein